MVVVRWAALVLVGLATLVSAPAVAAAQERQVVARFTAPFEDTIDCGEYGPYDFDDVFSGMPFISNGVGSMPSGPR